MFLDAIVLAGGRSSRLGGVAKAQLTVHGRPLVRVAVEAAGMVGARRVVVVGPSELTVSAKVVTDDSAALSGVRPSVLTAREEPAFGGPAAGVAAGLAALSSALSSSAAEYTLVLACDHPHAIAALEALRAAAAGRGSDAMEERDAPDDTDGVAGIDGWVAVGPDGRHQYLCALHRTASLARRVVECAEGSSTGDLDGLSMRALLRPLSLREVPVPAESVADVDTWHDAERLGVDVPAHRKGAMA